MPREVLFESDSEAEEQQQITINEHYAKAFEYKKEREELQKLKDKYGSDYEEDGEGESTDSESLESEDEDGEELTPAMDAAILRTLARIKRKDPEIYTAGKSVFEEEKQKIATPTFTKSVKNKDTSKPITLRQVALEEALEPTSRSPSPEPLTHVQEQAALRDETIAAFKSAVEDASDDELLVPRSKTKDEVEQEEEEYRSFLEREVGADLKNLVAVEEEGVAQNDEEPEPVDVKKKKKGKSKATTVPKSKQEADQEFLMNYILNRGWIDHDAKRVPTYKQVTGGKGKGKAQDSDGPDSGSEGDGEGGNNLDDEDEFDDLVDHFESSYNFRFEEPDAAVIPSFPRNIGSTVRREETTRKDARARKKQRKEEELLKKREEVKRLKALKMKDIRKKLEKIGKEGGKDLESEALQELDLEGDWDPEAHDKQMSGLYHDDDDDVDADKPQWDDDIDIGDIIMDEDEPSSSTQKKKKKKKSKKADEDADDEGGVDIDKMDADVEQDEEEWDGTEEMRKKKLDEYMDEVYGLEFNDLVGDLPTRFKYVPIQPEAFALTPAEILMATDQELNEFMSIKKYAPYKTGPKKWDKSRNDKLKELKQKIAERTGQDYNPRSGRQNRGSGDADRVVKKRKGKKERMKMKALTEGQDDSMDTKMDVDDKPNGKAKRQRDENVDEGRDDEEKAVPRENGAPSKRKRRKHKKEQVAVE